MYFLQSKSLPSLYQSGKLKYSSYKNPNIAKYKSKYVTYFLFFDKKKYVT